MNNFEQNAEIFGALAQIANNLSLMVREGKLSSTLERDILLQQLRDAYLQLLKLSPDAEPVQDIAVSAPAVPEIPEEEADIVPQVKEVPAAEEAPEEEILPEEPCPPAAEEPAEIPAEEEPATIAPLFTEEEMAIDEPVPEVETKEAPVAEPATPAVTEQLSEEPEAQPEEEENVVEPEPQTPAPELETPAAPVSETAREAAATLLNGSSDILDFLGSKIMTEEEALDFPEEPETTEEKAQPSHPTPAPAPSPAPTLTHTPTPTPSPTNAYQAPEETILTKPTPVPSQPAPSLNERLAQEHNNASNSAPKVTSLNDLLNQKKEDNSLATQFQHARIEDLSKAISLNDKFLYIKELFKNDGEKFSLAIRKLNSCTSMEEAFGEIELLKKYYFWDTTTPAYISLCDLVKRKFM
ncbi:MAG: hypothetical protein J5642_07585 [Bacteroidales bacterium]|nr:hypothetical protein [Bacteroidales bacterium]